MSDKKLEFATGKGQFIIVDGTEELTQEIADLIRQSEWSIRLDDVRHAKAREILDQSLHTGLFAHYVDGIPVNTYCYKDWRDSLHSLIKSKGWYLENPYGNEPIRPTVSGSERHKQIVHFDFFKQKSAWQEAESRTLHNPVVFKIK